MKFILTLMLLLVMATNKLYANELYPLNSSQKEVQFSGLLKSLRCLVCQNQDLADSQAVLAKDLRQEIYSMVKEGYSDQAIVGYLTSRYGDFILFNPPFKSRTFLLWFGPVTFLLLGLLIFWKTSFIQGKE